MSFGYLKSITRSALPLCRRPNEELPYRSSDDTVPTLFFRSLLRMRCRRSARALGAKRRGNPIFEHWPLSFGRFRAQRASIMGSPSPLTVNTTRWPPVMDTVGIKMPVITTIPRHSGHDRVRPNYWRVMRVSNRILGRAFSSSFAVHCEATSSVVII
jgi:hypothetical protein